MTKVMAVQSVVVSFKDIVGSGNANYTGLIGGNNPKMLTIPSYQRPFDWGKPHIKELMDDTTTAIEDGDEEYYLGPVGIHDQGDGRLDVVDGQQRMSAATLIAVAIRDHCIDIGLHELANSIHKHAIFLDGEPRLESGLQKTVQKLNQNRTQLAVLQHWPSGEPCRPKPPTVNSMIMEVHSGDENNDGEDIPVGNTFARFKLTHIPFDIPATTLVEFGGNSLELVEAIDASNEIDERIKVISVRNNGPDPISPGTVAELENPITTDLTYLGINHGGNYPDKRQKMFLRYQEVRKEIQSLTDGAADRAEEQSILSKFYTMVLNYKFTITLFPKLPIAVTYFEKTNDPKYTVPLNSRDLFNYFIGVELENGKDRADTWDAHFTTGPKITDILTDIETHWDAIQEMLQPLQVTKKKEGHTIVGDFFMTIALSTGDRVSKQKSLTWVQEWVGLKRDVGDTANSVRDFYEHILRQLVIMWQYASCYSLVHIPIISNSRSIRTKHITRLFTQGRSLLTSGMREFRLAASVNQKSGAAEIDFNSDSDYLSKAKDFHRLELRLISLLEWHVGRSIVLRHEDDAGLSGGKWWSEVEKWNRALNLRHPKDRGTRKGFSITELTHVVDAIERGGTITISKDGGSTTEDLELEGLKTLGEIKNPNFSNAGAIDNTLVEQRWSIKESTFLMYKIEIFLRDYYGTPKPDWIWVDIDSDQSLEHILPQSCWKKPDAELPVPDWEWWDPNDANVEDKNEIRDFCERLGNMCLVKKKYNSSYGNKSFTHKQTHRDPDYHSFDVLKDSWLTMADLSTTSDDAYLATLTPYEQAHLDLPDHHASLPYAEWTTSQINERNAWLFKLLYEIFE